MPTNHDETLQERYEREHRQMENRIAEPEAVRLNATVPDGYTLVKVDLLKKWKDRVNTLATLSLKRERHQVGIEIKQQIADEIAAAPAAPQPEQQPLTFAGVAKRKLDDLKAQGYNVVGYMLARAEADYTVQRGAIDTGGMVIWWNREPLLTVEMVDAAMVEMSNIHPPLKRSECERLLRAAMASRLVEWAPAVQHLPADDTEGGAA